MSGPWRLLEGPAGSLRLYSSTTPGSEPGRLLLLCHELPLVPGEAPTIGRTFPALADRLAHESGWRAATATLRGAGGSEGDFSVEGWLEDLRFVLDHERTGDEGVHVVGFGLGGALALRVAAQAQWITGVAVLGTPNDLAPWSKDPDALLQRCQASGVVGRAGFPDDVVAWAQQLDEIRPEEAVGDLGDRPLLVIHGTEDGEVPAAAAAALAQAARGPVQLRVVGGAGHWLRADPRVVATLIGWLERQR